MTPRLNHWGRLFAEARKAGILAPGQRPAPPPPPRERGRPPALRAARWSGYEGWDPNRQRRPRCMFRGCGRWLRRDQVAFCDHCVEAVRDLLRQTDEAAAEKAPKKE